MRLNIDYNQQNVANSSQRNNTSHSQVCLSNTFPSIVYILLNIHHILSNILFVFHEQQRNVTLILYLFSEIHN